jgi:hypothetical protein
MDWPLSPRQAGQGVFHLKLAPDLRTGLEAVLVLERFLSLKINVCSLVQIADGYGFSNGVGEFEYHHCRPGGKACKSKQDGDQAEGGEPTDQVGIANHHDIAHLRFSSGPFTPISILS